MRSGSLVLCMEAAWIKVAAYDAFVGFSWALIPGTIIWGLQMSMGQNHVSFFGLGALEDPIS